MSVPHPTVEESVGALQLPPIVLGTMTFGDTADEDTAVRMIEEALDSGVTWIDTANAYVAGRTEEILGRALAGRDDVVVATKAGQPHPEVGTEGLLSPALLRRAVEGSLRRLRRERVELLYLHAPDRSTPIGDTLGEVARLHDEGKIARLGVSNYSSWQTAEIITVARQVGAPAPALGQHMYNLLARRIEDEYQEYALTTGLPTVIYNPLAGGLLTGRYRLREEAEPGRFATARNAQQYRDRYWDPRLFEAVERLSAVADEAGIPLTELALRWAASRPLVQSVLVGASRPEQLGDSIAALRRGPLPADVVEAANAVGDELRGPMPAYNR